MSLYDFIQQVAALPDLTHERIVAFLGQPGQADGETDYHRSFKFGTIAIDQTLTASQISLREARERDGSSPTLLAMTLSGRCIGRDEVKPHFAQMALIGVPRGRSDAERMVYETMIGNMAVRFGFDQTPGACLVKLTFETRA